MTHAHRDILALAAVLSAFLACAGGAAASEAPAPGHDAASAPVRHPGVERALLRQVNRVRAARDRPRLRVNRALVSSARAHSRWLAEGRALRHSAAPGVPFWTRITAAGYPRQRLVGQNLARMSHCRGSVDRVARRVVAAWLRSPTHRRNLLDGRFRHAGVSAQSGAGCAGPVSFTLNFGA